MTTLIYSKHMLFYFPLQIIIFWLQSFDKSLKPNFCASWPRSCVVPLFTDSPVWCKTRQSEDKTPKTGEAQMWTFWNEFWGPKSDRCWWMVVNDCKIWVVSPWHQISFCLLRLQMKQKRSDRRAWTWFREEDLFWKQDDCRWSNHENWLSRIQKIKVLLDFQNVLRVISMDRKISLEKCLSSRSQVQVSRSSSSHLWEVRTIDTASTLFIEGYWFARLRFGMDLESDERLKLKCHL